MRCTCVTTRKKSEAHLVRLALRAQVKRARLKLNAFLEARQQATSCPISVVASLTVLSLCACPGKGRERAQSPDVSAVPMPLAAARDQDTVGSRVRGGPDSTLSQAIGSGGRSTQPADAPPDVDFFHFAGTAPAPPVDRRGSPYPYRFSFTNRSTQPFRLRVYDNGFLRHNAVDRRLKGRWDTNKVLSCHGGRRSHPKTIDPGETLILWACGVVGWSPQRIRAPLSRGSSDGQGRVSWHAEPLISAPF